MLNRINKKFLLTIQLAVIFSICSISASLADGSNVKQDQKLSVSISKTNGETIRKYEKLELELELKNAKYENPYDPAQINLFAIFTAPSGKQIRINGFYDNYKNSNKWKIRFSPNETGKYSYQVFLENHNRAVSTDKFTFKGINSTHHGWIKPSDNNPHYFEHDDGTSYYAVGVYSPWGNDWERFETFAKYDANLFAIWDIGYGGFINETGILEEELGRYNQEKLGRIDSLLTILEKDDIKLMYAIWPHDLFSETVWAAEWDKNPYRNLIDVEDVYSDSLVWEYQKRKYRYLIARFAHSRSWGIWELINEMNGTDGWVKGRHEEAYEWVAKCDKFFEEHDPYNHPTTASFSGGFNEYREPLYTRNDIPNIHFYPKQGWPLKYPEDSLRSAMHNYARATQRFWNTYEKPAIFGEAGADLAYFESDREEYHITYHNAIWATLSNGLAGIPVWWQYPHLIEQDWQHLQYLSQFVSDIDFAALPYQPAKSSACGADVYIMDSGKLAFGWIRTYEKSDVSGVNIQIINPKAENFQVEWFNTWTGEIIETEKVKAENGMLEITTPNIAEARPDVAFKIFSD